MPIATNEALLTMHVLWEYIKYKLSQLKQKEMELECAFVLIIMFVFIMFV